MFEKNYFNIRNVRESVTENVNVTVKNAPTDESVSLLKELEEKAMSKILGSLKVEDNSFNITGVFIQNDFNGKSFHGSYKLNSVEYKIKVDLGWSIGSRETMIKEIFENVAREVAVQLMMQADPRLWQYIEKAARL